MRLFSRASVSMAPIVENNLIDLEKVIATNLRATFLALAQAAEHVAKGGLILALSR